jgi:hypothetical protein
MVSLPFWKLSSGVIFSKYRFRSDCRLTLAYAMPLAAWSFIRCSFQKLSLVLDDTLRERFSGGVLMQSLGIPHDYHSMSRTSCLEHESPIVYMPLVLSYSYSQHEHVAT